MSNRVSMPSVPQQGVKKSPGAPVPSNALIRQLLTNGSRNDTAVLAAQAAAERSDPESDLEQSDDDDDDKSLGGRSKSGRHQLPRSALRSLVRGVLGNVRTSPDAINCLNSSGARFVLAVSRRASRICEENGRSLITGEDLLRAISAVGCQTLSNQLRAQFSAPAPSSASTAEQQEAEASVGGGKPKGRRPSEPVMGNVVGARKRRRGTTGGDGVDTEELQARQLAMLMEARQADDLAAQQLEGVVQVEVTTDEGSVIVETGVPQQVIAEGVPLIASQNTAVVVTIPPQGGAGIVEKATTAAHYTEDYDA